MLVDTEVLAELARPRPDSRVAGWAASVPLPIRVSVVTVEEIHAGLARWPNAPVAAWLARFLAEECELLAVTGGIARRAGELRGRFRAAGEKRSQADMLVAATAQAHQLPLVTRNLAAFEGCGIPLLDPWRFAGPGRPPAGRS